MEKTYDIRFENDCVGTVRVCKEGLYYRLLCSAKAPGCSKYRLIAKWENQQHDFGLCIPDEDHIGIVTRIPMKNFAEKDVEFRLEDYDVKTDSSFFPLSSQAPFPYLEHLECANLEWRDGVMGLCFQNYPSC